MGIFSRAILSGFVLLASGAAAFAADRAIIVLDASGSMWGQIDGKPKLEIARDTLRTVLQSVPSDMELGLMAYGHREKGSCSDIELVVPPAAGSASAITQAADAMKFLGKTPLTASVRQAAEALKYTEEKSTVILITDGIETCEADPCALGRELEEAGVDFTTHVVGFGLTADEGRQVACLAENTGGKFIQAGDAATLKDALTQTVVVAAPEPEPQPEPEPEPAPEPAPPAAAPEFNLIPEAVMAAGGEPLANSGIAWEIYRRAADGSAGEHVTTDYDGYKGTLEPGSYVVRARLGEVRVDQQLTVEAGEVYKPVFVLNAGTLIVRPRASEAEGVSDSATVLVEFSGRDGPATHYGETKTILPAGEIKVTVRIGSGEITQTVNLAAGQTVEKDIVVGVGHVTVNALYAEGGERVAASGLDVKIFKAAKKIDGTRDQVTYAYGPDAKFDLPPGDYVAVLRLDQAEVEQPFTVRSGEAGDVTANLDAGVLAITAPGARNINVFSATKDIQGERKQFGYGFDGAHQTTLPAGSYVVTTDRQDDSPARETPVTVNAGERTEVTID